MPANPDPVAVDMPAVTDHPLRHGGRVMGRFRWSLFVASVAVVWVAAGALAFARPLTAAPSAAQRAAIILAFGDPPAAGPCLIVKLAASNHRYATVRPRRARSCARWAFNGVNVLKRTKPRHWRVVFEASAFRCPVPAIPRRVQRDFGFCP